MLAALTGPTHPADAALHLLEIAALDHLREQNFSDFGPVDFLAPW
jgi:hypothetical protein